MSIIVNFVHPDLAGRRDIYLDGELRSRDMGAASSSGLSEDAVNESQHRPLSVFVQNHETGSVDRQTFDTGIGCSTIYAYAGFRLGVPPTGLNVSHGRGCARPQCASSPVHHFRIPGW